jgi:hypothetical protein
MAVNEKITELGELTSPAVGDLLAIVDVDAPNVLKKITLTNLFSLVSSDSIADADDDTKVEVEQGADDDTVRIISAGLQMASFKAGFGNGITIISKKLSDDSGDLNIQTEQAENVGDININAGNSTVTHGGTVSITSGNGAGDIGGAINLSAGSGDANTGGAIGINAGDGVSYHGGAVNIGAGDATVSGNYNGGNIIITAGDKAGTGNSGKIQLVTESGTVEIDGGNMNIPSGKTYQINSVQIALANLSDGADHSARHESGGADAIKLDDLAAPDDNTDLDVSTTKHGLAPKAPNDATKYLNGVGAYTVPAGGGGGWTKKTISGNGAQTWDGDDGNYLELTCSGGNVTLSFQDMVLGPCRVRVIQDGTGSRTVTWSGNWYFPGGNEPTLSTGASEFDDIDFFYDGTYMCFRVANYNQS